MRCSQMIQENAMICQTIPEHSIHVNMHLSNQYCICHAPRQPHLSCFKHHYKMPNQHVAQPVNTHLPSLTLHSFTSTSECATLEQSVPAAFCDFLLLVMCRNRRDFVSRMRSRCLPLSEVLMEDRQDWFLYQVSKAPDMFGHRGDGYGSGGPDREGFCFCS